MTEDEAYSFVQMMKRCVKQELQLIESLHSQVRYSWVLLTIWVLQSQNTTYPATCHGNQLHHFKTRFQ